MVLPAHSRRDAGHGRSLRSILIDVGGRPSLFKMGKLGILWQLDRKTGAFVRATDLGYQNILDVDQSGKVTYRPGMIPQLGVQISFCPRTAGFKSWRAMAFNPQTNALYVPMNLNCEIATFGPTAKVAGGGGTGPVRRKNTKHPQSDGNLGEFLALDVTSGKILWRHRRRRRRTPRRSRRQAESCSVATGIDTCTRTTRQPGRCCGRRACRRPHRDSRSRISPTANSTWRCRRESAAGACRR